MFKKLNKFFTPYIPALKDKESVIFYFLVFFIKRYILMKPSLSFCRPILRYTIFIIILLRKSSKCTHYFFFNFFVKPQIFLNSIKNTIILFLGRINQFIIHHLICIAGIALALKSEIALWFMLSRKRF